EQLEISSELAGETRQPLLHRVAAKRQSAVAADRDDAVKEVLVGFGAKNWRGGKDRRRLRAVEGDDPLLSGPACEGAPILHSEELRSIALLGGPCMWYERVPVLAPAPEDHLVGLKEIANVAEEPVEDREILRRLRSLDREQDLSLQRLC